MGSLVPSGGSVRLVGEELLAASDRRLRQLRATAMAMVFQEPMTALNPVVPVGRQIDEMLRVHTDLDAARARRRRILSMMEQVRRHAGGGRNGLGGWISPCRHRVLELLDGRLRPESHPE
jgi:ABC-type microcin C transport system duplicated ATPase subunit YejF